MIVLVRDDELRHGRLLTGAVMKQCGFAKPHAMFERRRNAFFDHLAVGPFRMGSLDRALRRGSILRYAKVDAACRIDEINPLVQRGSCNQIR